MLLYLLSLRVYQDLIRLIEGNWGPGENLKLHSFFKLLSKTNVHFTELSNRRKDSAFPLGKRFLGHFSLINVENILRTNFLFK